MIHKIVIGDWSRDGHEKYEYKNFESNLTAEEVKTAYLNTCKKSGVSLHEMDDCFVLCADYQDSLVPDFAIEALAEVGVDFPDTEELHLDTDSITELFLEMVKASRPDFEYSIIAPEKPLNGFWQEIGGFGYGLYD